MSLLSLPNETVSTVFEFVTSATDLAAAVRVCRRLHGVGERALYTNIVIVDPIDNQSSSVVIPHKTVCCCTTILRKEYLASFIKKFHLRWTKDQVRIAEGRIPQPVVERLSRVLRRSNHIESLELHLAGFSGFYQEILDQCFFQLRYLSLSGSTNKPIEWFLHSQPTLVHLHLGDQHLPLTLLTEDLPVLEWFRGDPITAASILPFRPVTGLSLIGREPTEDCLRAFSDSSIPIRALDLGGLSITPMQLVMISKHLSALESLRMRLALRHTLHFTFSGMMLLAPLTQVLRDFHSLCHLDLSPTSVDGIRGIRVETDELALCVTWAAVCPSLQQVKFPSGTDWRKSADAWVNMNPYTAIR